MTSVEAPGAPTGALPPPPPSLDRSSTAPRGRRRRRAATAGWYVTLTALSVVILFPVYMALVEAVSAPLAYLSSGLPPYPVSPQWGVFARAWDRGDLGHHLLVSMTVTLIIVAAQLLTSIAAAYAFAFLRFPFRRVLFALFIATLMLPIEVTLITNVRLVRDLHWMNSLAGLTVPFMATALGTFLIRQGFLGVPRDLRDAARLDGFGDLAFLRRVAVPVTRPIIASFAVISFLAAWNQYVWPRAITTQSSAATIQIALRSFTQVSGAETNLGPAAAIIAAIPVLVLLIAFQRQIIRGLTAGAVKG
jgi:sn-glycerol 3-phosphate transport system permease protein